MARSNVGVWPLCLLLALSCQHRSLDGAGAGASAVLRGADAGATLSGSAVAIGGSAPITALPDAAHAPAGPPRKSLGPPRAGERVPLLGGTFLAGSLPGDEGRDPRMEPAALSVTLGPYEIDRLPYPNDPAERSRTDVTREDAARLCHEKGERLCTELEWERACKGTTGQDAYAPGDEWDAACAHDALHCPSGFGVLAMGDGREWTASDLVFESTTGKPDVYRAIMRGAATEAEAVEHRCAHRGAADAAERAKDVGFRCCQGPPNAAVIPAPKLGPIVRRATIEPARLAEIFGTVSPAFALQRRREAFHGTG